MSDPELLKRYLCENSQSAFATLVDRYVNLVYSAARRQVRSTQLAEDVAQSVFLDLARNAARLRPEQPLAAWLYLVTRRTAVDVVRRETRRQAREQIAVEIAAMKSPSPTWAQVKDSLDEAMLSLNDTERTAILLRFFENRSLREIGATLGVSDDTAQKRVSRALERLRDMLLHQGVTVSAAGLATELSAHAIEAAPATLGSTIASAVSTAGVTISAAVVKTSQTVALAFAPKAAAAVAAAALLGVMVFQATTISSQQGELDLQPAEIAGLQATLRQLRIDQQTTARRLQDTREGLARPAQARPIADPEVESAIDGWMKRVSRLKELARERPDLGIPDLFTLGENDWFAAAKSAQLETEEQVRETFRGIHKTARTALARVLSRALRAYADAHDGQLPSTAMELAPFLDHGLPGGLLSAYEVLQTGRLKAVPVDELILGESPTFAKWTESRVIVSTSDHGVEEFSQVSDRQFRQAVRAFAFAQNGQLPAAAADVVPYLKMRPSAEALEKFLAKSGSDLTPDALGKFLSP